MSRLRKFLIIFILPTILIISACLSQESNPVVTEIEPSETNVSEGTSTVVRIVENSTSTSTALPTMTSIPTKTATASQPSSTATPLLPTTTPTAITSVFDVEAVRRNTKAAYTAFEADDRFQLWILDSLDAQARPILSERQQNPWLTSAFSWSNSGQYIAVMYLIEDGFLVSKLDIDTLEEQQLNHSVPFPDDSTSIEFIGLSGWSSNDEWLAVKVGYRAETSYWEETTLVSATSDETIELAPNIDFMGWSPTEPDKYIYILRPNSPHWGGESVHLKSVDQNESESTIAHFGEYSPRRTASLSPDGSKAIVVVQSESNVVETNHLLLDFEEGKWYQLPTSQTYNYSPSIWSPNGQWITYFDRTHLYFGLADNLEQSFVAIETNHEFAIPLAWLADGTSLLYQDDNIIYLVDPLKSDDPVLIFDLNNLDIASQFQIIIKVWVSDQK